MDFRPTHVIYHGNCYDGFGAAFAVWQRFPDAKYIPALYSDSVPDLPSDAEVLICDFSYKRPVLLALKASVKNLMVLDHHKTAQAELEGLDFVHFDMSKSGSVLAYEWVHPQTPYIPIFFLYLQDRDLWQFKLEGSHAVHAALTSYPFEFEVWSKLSQSTTDLVAEGCVVLRHINQLVDLVTAKPMFLSVVGYTVPVVNCCFAFSEMPHALCKKYPDYPFDAYYYDRAGIRQWGLRSIGDFDVSVLAKKMGGGGHKNAAGFEVKLF